ncbi:MAG: sigma-54 dependent transcriptional regulator [Acidobacteriaceae bacterium]|nr:sigma-54 dependent transcriptional regulator [Acidobacteriaceae bacterium]
MAMSDSSAGKIVVLASADAALRQRLRQSLVGMRWTVREAVGGADAIAQMEDTHAEALVMDHWLPDLEAAEFAGQVRLMYPGVDVLRVDGDPVEGSQRSPRRHELLHALREALEDLPVSLPAQALPEKSDGAAWASAPLVAPGKIAAAPGAGFFESLMAEPVTPEPTLEELAVRAGASLVDEASGAAAARVVEPVVTFPVDIPGMVGASAGMHTLARLIRLVAPTSATVLIEGETGTGKEVVAQALHALSLRANKPFAVLNCAAIPESLLEAELFGHTRGAFTGAVTSRTGRIEAAHGGTLFLDEIGEMPLALQAKMLRFLECGELQRVGDNEVVRVDVRVIAATHQDIERRAEQGTFRLDLYHRLAVFPLEVPALRTRKEDIPALSEFFLTKLGEGAPRKRLSPEALVLLQEYEWPGNVRELGHVLHRATIMAAGRMELLAEDIRLRRAGR